MVINLCLFLFHRLLSKLEKESKGEKETSQETYVCSFSIIDFCQIWRGNQKWRRRLLMNCNYFTSIFLKETSKRFMAMASHLLVASRRIFRLFHTWSRTEKSLTLSVLFFQKCCFFSLEKTIVKTIFLLF